MGSVAGLWELLRETRRRGQEQWFAPNRLTELRRLRLRRLIGAAAETPYYREAFASVGLKQSDLTQDGILTQLPVLEKATLQQRGTDLLTRAVSPELVTVATSGSTGQPKGVLCRHGPMSHFLPWQEEVFDLKNSDHYSLLSGPGYVQRSCRRSRSYRTRGWPRPSRSITPSASSRSRVWKFVC